jgi:hypothetical protein
MVLPGATAAMQGPLTPIAKKQILQAMAFTESFSRRDSLALLATAAIAACQKAAVGAAPPEAAGYRWRQLTKAAAFPTSYNYPVHAVPDGRFVALHPQGTWSSRDGAEWTRESLPPSGSNSAYLGTLQHRGGAVALGRHTGNYLDFQIDPVIAATADYRAWTMRQADNLPAVIFYGHASFDDHLWILGGFDGQALSNAVWRSSDGIAWERMPDPPWSPRAQPTAAVMGDRLLLIGGGAIDGMPGSERSNSEVWATADGKSWERIAERVGTPDPVGFRPQMFDGKLWLVGANRSGGFTSSMIVTADGRSWDRVEAPWSPRGGVATWTDGARMYLTGGKYSREIGGEWQFEYSNDVWAMERA